ncbi:hypothetical protein m02_10260, partial [Bartonella bovis m02]
MCDGRKGENGMLTTKGSGDIEIKMNMHPSAEAVKITGGADITIMKKLKVTGWSGKNLPVIKVEKGGELTLKGGVEVEGVVGTGKVIEVDGGMVVLGEGVKKVEGKGSGEVMLVNNGGTLMMMGNSAITIKGSGGKGVQMGSTETLVMMRNVIFENVSEGINIKGSKETGLSVMGMGVGKTTMTVNGSGVVGIKVEGSGSIDATVMRLSIVGEGTGSGSKGVEFKGTGGKGKLNMTSVDVSGFATGVSASGNGTLNIMGNSRITFKENGTGLEVKGEANATMMGGKIVGSGKGTGVYGVKMMGSGTVKMDGVGISNVEKGVYVENGTVEMMGTAITVKGDGKGTGYGVGVGVSGGAVSMMGGSIMVINDISGNAA